jgi:hypothetical protein
MWSALPWSAVTNRTPPVAWHRAHHLAQAGVGGLHRRDRGGDDARVADHVGLAKLMIANAGRSSSHAATNAAAAARALISGLWSYVGTSRGLGTSSRRSPAYGRLLPAVEEVRHVRVLLRLGHVELAAARPSR